MHDDETAQELEQTTEAATDVGRLMAAIASDGRDETLWRWSRPAKVAFIFAAVVLPVVCFVFTSVPDFGPDWQSGDLGAYAKLLLMPKPAAAFFPLLLYSMISMVWMVFRPEWASRRFWIRFGIYTGTILAIQYLLLLAVTPPGNHVEAAFIFILIVPSIAALIWGILWFLAIYWKKTREPRFARTLIVVSTALVLLVMVLTSLWMIPILLLLFCATPWAVIAYWSMSWHILRRRTENRWQFSLAQLLAFVFWMAAYCSAWRLAVKVMLVEYAKLPTTPPPTCYIATAAARGHRWLVRAEPVGYASSGKTFCVNDQMRRLKAAELVLAVTWPWMHRRCRAVYDRMGPRAAAMLVRPVLADAAYLAMKPAEWAARVALALLLAGDRGVVERLYRDRENG